MGNFFPGGVIVNGAVLVRHRLDHPAFFSPGCRGMNWSTGYLAFCGPVARARWLSSRHTLRYRLTLEFDDGVVHPISSVIEVSLREKPLVQAQRHHPSIRGEAVEVDPGPGTSSLRC